MSETLPRIKLLMCILVASTLSSCQTGYQLTELYSQQIENSDNEIIEYLAMSATNDGVNGGRLILNKNETINLNDVEQMQFNFFAGCPTKDTLFVVQLKEGGTRNPKYISTEISNYKGWTVKTSYYTYEVGTSHSLTYKFSTFRETKDSLIISGIEKEQFNTPTGNNEIAFLKGNVKLVESDSRMGIVKQIDIPAFLLRSYNSTPVDKATLINSDSLQVDGLVNFTFEPIGPIKVSDFSNFGIFKKRKIRNVKAVQ